MQQGEEKFPYSEPTEEELQEINNKLFSDEVTNLGTQQRTQLAHRFIDHFGHKVVDDELIQQAQITPDNISEDIKIKLKGRDQLVWELWKRIQYAQLLTQLVEGEKVYPYSKVIIMLNSESVESLQKARRREKAELSPSGKQVIKNFIEPFIISEDGMIIQSSQEKGRTEHHEAVQAINRLQRSIGGKHIIPSQELVGVARFSKE